MIFAKHNYYSNFCNASGADDFEMQRDMVITEITKIIADNGKEFMEAISASGIIPSPSNSPEVMVDLFINNIGNKKFQKNLAAIILSNNKIPNDAKLQIKDLKDNSQVTATANNLIGKDNGTLVPQAVNSNTSTLEASANVIDEISKTLTTPESKKELRAHILSAIVNGNKTTKPFSFGKFLFWSGAIGLCVWAYVKYSKKATT